MLVKNYKCIDRKLYMSRFYIGLQGYFELNLFKYTTNFTSQYFIKVIVPQTWHIKDP